MTRRQTVVHLSEELLARLASHRHREGRSRSDVVREAIERYLTADPDAEIDRLIVDAYKRQPAEDAGNERAAKQMISAEPW
jgi:metal-responsive CopG/Arc/MetJ family transcriptional regulator